MKILFYEVQHFSPNYQEFTGSKAIFSKKKSPFLAQKLEKKCFVKIHFRLYKTKKKNGPLSHWCREGKTLVVRPQKNVFFYVCLPLVSNIREEEVLYAFVVPLI